MSDNNERFILLCIQGNSIVPLGTGTYEDMNKSKLEREKVNGSITYRIEPITDEIEKIAMTDIYKLKKYFKYVIEE